MPRAETDINVAEAQTPRCSPATASGRHDMLGMVGEKGKGMQRPCMNQAQKGQLCRSPACRGQQAGQQWSEAVLERTLWGHLFSHWWNHSRKQCPCKARTWAEPHLPDPAPQGPDTHTLGLPRGIRTGLVWAFLPVTWAQGQGGAAFLPQLLSTLHFHLQDRCLLEVALRTYKGRCTWVTSQKDKWMSQGKTWTPPMSTVQDHSRCCLGYSESAWYNFSCRVDKGVHHAKCQAGWSTSWKQDCWEKYQ